MGQINYTTSDFNYDLPGELIADTPPDARDSSRLLVINNLEAEACEFADLQFDSVVKFLDPGDLIVFNDSKVIKARLFGHKVSGAKVELLIERVVNCSCVIAHIRTNKTIKLGLEISLPNQVIVVVDEILDGRFSLRLKDAKNSDFDWYGYLDKFGHIPLPPYIKREAVVADETNYQTVYAQNPGSVAAPTAGLHFTLPLLEKIKKQGVNIAHVTLHVGSGTFKPVSTENLNEHKMHSEVYQVTSQLVELIQRTQACGGKIIAVGTTTLRVLETLALNQFKRLSGETDIFITPGFDFKVVDKLITNFHLPKSTLLMLVSAFAGFERIKHVYSYAIKHQYRFFSYGDAMLLERSLL